MTSSAAPPVATVPIAPEIVHPPILAIGLISGTSADGVDAAMIETDGLAPPRLLGAISRPYPDEMRARVLALIQPGAGEVDALGVLDRDLGERFAAAALDLCRTLGRRPEEVTVIGSHGQTARHRPPDFTLQIGDPFRISALTGIATVADFRRADFARGGEGAPLAPFFHQACFSQPGRRVAVINLGGIANVTALYGEPERPTIAGDTGPANTLMDLLAQRISGGGETCDRDGAQAAQGRIDPRALAWMMDHPYLRQPFPKSTGRELFGADFLEEFLTRFPAMTEVDRFATLTAFSAESVAQACRTLLPPHPHRAVLCGGGTRNAALVEGLRARLPETEVASSSAFGVDADSLEAQAFAWFAVRTLRGLPSSLPGATGAREPALLGAVYPGANGLPRVGG